MSQVVLSKEEVEFITVSITRLTVAGWRQVGEYWVGPSSRIPLNVHKAIGVLDASIGRCGKCSGSGLVILTYSTKYVFDEPEPSCIDCKACGGTGRYEH